MVLPSLIVCILTATVPKSRINWWLLKDLEVQLSLPICIFINSYFNFFGASITPTFVRWSLHGRLRGPNTISNRQILDPPLSCNIKLKHDDHISFADQKTPVTACTPERLKGRLQPSMHLQHLQKRLFTTTISDLSHFYYCLMQSAYL